MHYFIFAYCDHGGTQQALQETPKWKQEERTAKLVRTGCSIAPKIMYI